MPGRFYILEFSLSELISESAQKFSLVRLDICEPQAFPEKNTLVQVRVCSDMRVRETAAGSVQSHQQAGGFVGLLQLSRYVHAPEKRCRRREAVM